MQKPFAQSVADLGMNEIDQRAFIAVEKRYRGRCHVSSCLHHSPPLGEQAHFQMKYDEQGHEQSS